MNATRSWLGEKCLEKFFCFYRIYVFEGLWRFFGEEGEGLKCFSLIKVDCDYWESSEVFIEKEE
jgi:hypothetical protein